MESLLNALFVGVAVFTALELHVRLSVKRENGEPLVKTPWSPTSTKAELLEPWTEEDYETHLKENSSRGQLLRKVISSAPWSSRHQKSQSSDSSTNTE